MLIIDSTCKVKTQVEEHETREGDHISNGFAAAKIYVGAGLLVCPCAAKSNASGGKLFNF